MTGAALTITSPLPPDLEHAVGLEGALVSDLLGRVLRDLTPVGANLAHHGLDFLPQPEAVLVGPDAGHVLACVTVDHRDSVLLGACGVPGGIRG